MKTAKTKGASSKDVDLYIANAPSEARTMLSEMRQAVLQAAPEAKESISYQMPFYDCHGRLAYFAAQKGYIGLYLPPPIVENYKEELADYVTTKSAIHFPLDKKLPLALIKKMVKARLSLNSKKLEFAHKKKT